MQHLPKFASYCPNTTQVNALVFELGEGSAVYYSYRTPVAFRVAGHLVVRENVWGPTTGKHLNAIDGGSKAAKKARVPGEAFELMLSKLGRRCTVANRGTTCGHALVPLSGNVMGCPAHGIATSA